MPPPTPARLEQPVGELWRDRLGQAVRDYYMGVPMSKVAEDLRVYEHLLWLARPNVIIEIGCYRGGSALWFRDRLRSLAAYGLVRNPRVISIDLDTSHAEAHLRAVDPRSSRAITLVAGDVRDPGLPARVRRLLPRRARCLISEDGAHTYETTAAALRSFAPFVSPGSFFVVEDAVVDIEELRLDPAWPRGVRSAITDWLASDQGGDFVMRRDLELYGITSNPWGCLQRQAD